MISIYLEVATFTIQINFRPTEKAYFRYMLMTSIKKAYANFIVRRPKNFPHFYIDIYMKDTNEIIVQKNKHGNCLFTQLYYSISRNRIVASYTMSIWQFQFMVRRVLESLLKNNGFILHASAVAKDNNAILFMGNPGAGKTTIARLLGKEFNVIADDSVIIMIKEHKFELYQTPFIESNQSIERSNRVFNIQSVFFLKKSDTPTKKALDNQSILLQRFIHQILSLDPVSKTQVKLCIEFIKQHKFYQLFFSNKKDTIHFLQKIVYE